MPLIEFSNVPLFSRVVMAVVVEEMIESRWWKECDGQGCMNSPRLNLVTDVQWGLSETVWEGGETILTASGIGILQNYVSK